MVTIDSDDALACPTCGELNLHQGEPVAIAKEHGFPRGGGIVIEFWCEHCGSDKTMRLQIGQHKGTTYIQWL